ncbi:D-aminoacyl-tRNA deacylase [Robiginitalea aurantiaca]|uniref:D-aminoacyl-tRNA deacylase n=1 Tax=Robiginitalea aurantiaca TaxID=3056915 RepID=A0ABT7WHW6_9FLAO|nr:D-aminoacyl-tRNA deacylase [Robiginitalea aurantiaca]MDM9632520.1 D-aminoacyl-tRNA deacylase [Robiginitalea aurantiaca]
MRAVIQRVRSASVTVSGKKVSEIDSGLLILLGISTTDTQEDLRWLVPKIGNMRIFNDENGVMNRSVTEVKGDVIVVSQFTLMASTKKGNRPSYIGAARPEMAIPLYEGFVQEFEKLLGRKVGTGIFGADMKVDLCNDGPVTIMIDSRNRE